LGLPDDNLAVFFGLRYYFAEFFFRFLFIRPSLRRRFNVFHDSLPAGIEFSFLLFFLSRRLKNMARIKAGVKVKDK
jgi:hypothetical protein